MAIRLRMRNFFKHIRTYHDVKNASWRLSFQPNSEISISRIASGVFNHALPAIVVTAFSRGLLLLEEPRSPGIPFLKTPSQSRMIYTKRTYYDALERFLRRNNARLTRNGTQINLEAFPFFALVLFSFRFSVLLVVLFEAPFCSLFSSLWCV